jgi:hypothetical protein
MQGESNIKKLYNVVQVKDKPIYNCLLIHVIEGKLEGRIELTGRRGRRRKQLLDDLKEKRRKH